MAELGPGLYEALVTEGLKAQLDGLADRLPARVRTCEPRRLRIGSPGT